MQPPDINSDECASNYNATEAAYMTPPTSYTNVAASNNEMVGVISEEIDQKAETARKIAQEIPLLRSRTITQIAKLGCGLTNDVFLIKTKQGKYVFRSCNSNMQTRDIDLVKQANIAQQLSDLKIGPRVLYVSESKEHMIIEYFDGTPLADRSRYTRDVRDSIIEKLRAMHNSAKFDTSVNPFTTAFKFREISKKQSKHTRDLSDKITNADAIIEKIKKSISPHSEQYLCSAHNDLNLHNILLNETNNNLMLIDYDYAGRADLFYDLATLSINLELDIKEKEQLLASYFKCPPKPRDLAHIELMCMVVLYWYAMWYFSENKPSVQERDKDLKLGTACLDCFIQISEKRDFNEWLKILDQSMKPNADNNTQNYFNPPPLCFNKINQVAQTLVQEPLYEGCVAKTNQM